MISTDTRQRDPAERPLSGYYRGAKTAHPHHEQGTAPEPPHADGEQRKILNKIPKLETPSSAAGSPSASPTPARNRTRCSSHGNGSAGRGRAATDVSRAAPRGPLRSPGSHPAAHWEGTGQPALPISPFPSAKGRLIRIHLQPSFPNFSKPGQSGQPQSH